MTPEGGFRMGNPAAPIKLVEYGSLACPHCRHFEETGYKPLLQTYVRTGRVSYEFRNLSDQRSRHLGQPAHALLGPGQILRDVAICLRDPAAVAESRSRR